MRRWLTSHAMRPLWLLLMLIVLWDVAIRLFRIPPYLIPAPLAVAKQLATEWPMLWRETLPTLYATLGGFAASAIVGVPIAMWIAYSRTIESFVYPLLVFSQSVPKVAIAPLFVVWFGFGIIPKVIAAFLLGFFPVVGEFVGSNSGIGYVLQIANGNFDLPLMFAALTVLSMTGVILFALVDVV